MDDVDLSELDQLPRKRLQSLAKKAGIPANKKSAYIVAEIRRQYAETGTVDKENVAANLKQEMSPRKAKRKRRIARRSLASTAASSVVVEEPQKRKRTAKRRRSNIARRTHAPRTMVSFAIKQAEQELVSGEKHAPEHIQPVEHEELSDAETTKSSADGSNVKPETREQSRGKQTEGGSHQSGEEIHPEEETHEQEHVPKEKEEEEEGGEESEAMEAEEGEEEENDKEFHPEEETDEEEHVPKEKGIVPEQDEMVNIPPEEEKPKGDAEVQVLDADETPKKEEEEEEVVVEPIASEASGKDTPKIRTARRSSGAKGRRLARRRHSGTPDTKLGVSSRQSRDGRDGAPSSSTKCTNQLAKRHHDANQQTVERPAQAKNKQEAEATKTAGARAKNPEMRGPKRTADSSTPMPKGPRNSAKARRANGTRETQQRTKGNSTADKNLQQVSRKRPRPAGAAGSSRPDKKTPKKPRTLVSNARRQTTARGAAPKRTHAATMRPAKAPSGSKEKLSKARGAPDFAKIHQRAFDKMESIGDYAKRRHEKNNQHAPSAKYSTKPESLTAARQTRKIARQKREEIRSSGASSRPNKSATARHAAKKAGAHVTRSSASSSSKMTVAAPRTAGKSGARVPSTPRPDSGSTVPQGNPGGSRHYRRTSHTAQKPRPVRRTTTAGTALISKNVPKAKASSTTKRTKTREFNLSTAKRAARRRTLAKQKKPTLGK